jgi:hypothetical protein
MSEDRFQNKIYVGSGGMATVYHAWDSVVGRDVALKEIAVELREDAEVREMFLNEARKMAQVRHRNVVAVFDVLLDQDVPTIVQEFMSGGSLSNRVGASTMSVDETLNLLKDVFYGLRAIHQAGLVHRDMKPDNILLEKGEWKVADFGVAMKGDEDVLPFIGSKYAAPEVLNAPDTISARSDIYSMGIMAMELLLGSERFEMAAREAMLLAHGETPGGRDSSAAFWQRWVSSDVEIPLLSEINPVIPREVSEFIAALASRDPQRRPENCDAVIAEIDGLQSAEAMRLGAPTDRDPRVKASKAPATAADNAPAKKKSPLWFKLTAGIGLLLLVAIGALLLMPKRERVYDILLVSEPTGATVTLNGEDLADPTPVMAQLKIGDVLTFSLPRHEGAELTLAKGMDALSKDEEGQWTLRGELESSFALDSSEAAQAWLRELWSEAEGLGARIPAAPGDGPPYTIPVATPLYLELLPPDDGALTLLHLSSDNMATLIYPTPSGATLGLLGREAVTVGDELDLMSSEPLGREWFVLLLTRNPLSPPSIPGAGQVEDWARYYEFGPIGSPAEQLFLWLAEAVGDSPMAMAIVPMDIVAAEGDDQ